LLLTSSFLVAWAVKGAKAGLRRLPAALLAIASLIGCAFLVLKGYEYRQEFQEHLLPGIDFQFDAGPARGAELFFVFYFIVTGLHGVHVAIGIVVLLAVAWRAGRGAYGVDYHAPLTSAGLYWHLVDVIWIFLYALIYLPGRSGA
jgi:cytochrome c oxidase subunit 3